MERMTLDECQRVLVDQLDAQLPEEKRQVAVAGVTLVVSIARNLERIAAALDRVTDGDGAVTVNANVREA